MSQTISIIIKALNEEHNIARAIKSALAAVAETGRGEVIVADSLSTDRTVEIASLYPVKIVQLVNPSDRSCGVGAQLGYQVAQGRYLYVMDADMEVELGFLPAAVLALESQSNIAGVGGDIREMNIANAEFRSRMARHATHLMPGIVDRLNGGGLFRREAIDQLGYLTNRNLHGFEEFELAARLRSAGWQLLRLDMTAVRHFGHTDESYSLLKRRWASRYAWGAGELLRDSWGSRYFWFAVKSIPLYRFNVTVWFWWLSILLVVCGAFIEPRLIAAILALLLSPLLLATLKKRSWVDGAYFVTSANVYAMATVCGIFSKRRGSPEGSFSFKLLK